MPEFAPREVPVDFRISPDIPAPVYSNVNIANPIQDFIVIHFGYVDPIYSTLEVKQNPENAVLRPVPHTSVVLDHASAGKLVEQIAGIFGFRIVSSQDEILEESNEDVQQDSI